MFPFSDPSSTLAFAVNVELRIVTMARQARSTPSANSDSPTFDLPQYLASQGVLACLLVGSVFLLPRTSSFSISPSTHTSLDRPTHPVLLPVVADPAKTMMCVTAGSAICMLWWAPTLRAWWNPIKSSKKEERVRETLNVSERVAYRRVDSLIVCQRILAATAVTMIAAIAYTPALLILGAEIDRLVPLSTKINAELH